MTDPFSDNYLMTKVQNGDLEKLGLLFERYHRVLFAFFYKMNRDQGLSEDLVQEVFERILKYRKSYKGDGSFKAWIFHIARNLNKDHYKKRSRDVDQETFEVDEERTSEYKELQESELLEDNIIMLEKSLDMLPVEKKEILVLSKLKGMKYKEIGGLLGISEGAVKVKVFRALKDLQKVFIDNKNIQL